MTGPATDDTIHEIGEANVDLLRRARSSPGRATTSPDGVGGICSSDPTAEDNVPARRMYEHLGGELALHGTSAEYWWRFVEG